MGTRSLTVFKDGDKEIAVLYRQFDGYLKGGHGEELSKFLSGIKIVNGFSDKTAREANGMGCLAAQVVAEFKKCVGGFYLCAAGARDMWEDYTYTVTAPVEGFEPEIKVESYGDLIFDGMASDLLEKINNGCFCDED